MAKGFRKCPCISFKKSTETSVKILPSRYVWHVSKAMFECDKLLNRWSILNKGLCFKAPCSVCGEQDSYIYAHNCIETISMLDMYPIFVDFYTGKMELHEKRYPSIFHKLTEWSCLTIYDFYRIDTLAFNAEWWIDPLIHHEIKQGYWGNARPENYVYTNVEVPPHAIKVFSFDEFRFRDLGPKIVFQEGAVHFSERNLFDGLFAAEQVNVDKSNNYLQFTPIFKNKDTGKRVLYLSTPSKKRDTLFLNAAVKYPISQKIDRY